LKADRSRAKGCSPVPGGDIYPERQRPYGAIGILRKETLGLLKRFGVRVDPALDEQQLVDAGVIERLIDDAAVDRQDTVLEIGAGSGNITVALAGIAGKVFAVEKKGKFIPMLEERTASTRNVVLVRGDALRIGLPPFDKLVSNLPYSICEAVLNMLTRLKFERASLVVSSSFARTVTAGQEDPGFSRLSLLARAYFKAERREDVPPEAYHPPPGGPTSIVTIEPREAGGWRETILRNVLLQDDKKLKNALREAIIASSRAHGGPETKREARRLIESMALGSVTLEKKVARLSLLDLRLLQERL
jgi:16S rRNA (adenine1518-N6/adenine1519-N6)-dimethyltransferase